MCVGCGSVKKDLTTFSQTSQTVIQNGDATKHDPVLVIIDMQSKFRASNSIKIILQVARLIKKAIKANHRIFFVELGEEPTHAPLTQLCEEAGYGGRCWTVKKAGESGAREVAEKCLELCIEPREVVVCGVNTDACVKATVIGLAQTMPRSKVYVVKRACNMTKDSDPNWKNWNFERMRLHNRNVSFV